MGVTGQSVDRCNGAGPAVVLQAAWMEADCRGLSICLKRSVTHLPYDRCSFFARTPAWRPT